MIHSDYPPCDFVWQLNHNTDNQLWIFLLVQFDFTTSHILLFQKIQNKLILHSLTCSVLFYYLRDNISLQLFGNPISSKSKTSLYS